MTHGRRSKTMIAKAIAALVAVTAASIIVVVPASLPPSPSNPFTVKASAAGCLDDKGNPVTCPISLAPTPLPVGKTLGEQELSGLFGNAAGRATVQPYEFKSGSTIGHCLPRNAACGLTNEMAWGPRCRRRETRFPSNPWSGRSREMPRSPPATWTGMVATRRSRPPDALRRRPAPTHRDLHRGL